MHSEISQAFYVHYGKVEVLIIFHLHSTIFSQVYVIMNRDGEPNEKSGLESSSRRPAINFTGQRIAD